MSARSSSCKARQQPDESFAGVPPTVGYTADHAATAVWRSSMRPVLTVR